jgi:cytochrome c nitrite reductase small subunit
MPSKRPGWFRFFLIACIAGAGVGVFVAFGPPKLMAKSEMPDFCASCHVMESQYEAWFHQGAHRRKNCVECHLPNDNVAAHYVWKSIDGMKDVVVFNSGRVPEEIKISDHGRATVQANCVRCHETAVDKINQARSCTDCHRRLIHKRSGLVETQ